MASLEDELVWGIRPEQLVAADVGVEMTVKAVEPTGPEVRVLGRMAGQPVTCTLHPARSASSDSRRDAPTDSPRRKGSSVPCWQW